MTQETTWTTNLSLKEVRCPSILQCLIKIVQDCVRESRLVDTRKVGDREVIMGKSW